MKLSDSNEGGVLVHNGSELSLVMDVKAYQNLDITLVELKKLIMEKKSQSFLTKGKWCTSLLRLIMCSKY